MLSPAFIRYCVIGVGNLGLNVGLTASLHELLHAPEELAYGASLVTVLVLNFFLARWYIFDAASGSPHGQFARYLASAVSFRGLEYLAFLLVHTIIGVHYLAAVIGVQVTSFLAKFFFYRAFVFVSAKP